jgi:hypothetical protein
VRYEEETERLRLLSQRDPVTREHGGVTLVQNGGRWIASVFSVGVRPVVASGCMSISLIIK